MNFSGFPPTLKSAATLILFAPALTAAQNQPPFQSIHVHADRSVTFRYRDAAANRVELALEGQPRPLPMERDATGIWTITTRPLPPEIYGYHFESDGQYRLDPANTRIKPNLVNLENLFTVPGQTPQLWEPADVPHGAIHYHTYTTASVLNLPHNQSNFYVYTPPGYDPGAKQLYHVLYLLHGWSDDASSWTAVGQVHLILDNLIAQGKISPMVVVMPLGYGDIAFGHSFEGWQHPALVEQNTSLFTQALLTEIIPQVESAYRVSRKREDRAIAGLSMGGLESLSIGLVHSDRFAWVGGFSSAVQSLDFERRFASLDPATAHLRLLWIACGTDEPLLKPNLEFIAWLRLKGMPVAWFQSPGLHTWMVWRNDLIHFAPLLFRPK
jgi:enterochelin esterase family protein